MKQNIAMSSNMSVSKWQKLKMKKIENDHFNSMKMVSCKVLTIENDDDRKWHFNCMKIVRCKVMSFWKANDFESYEAKQWWLHAFQPHKLPILKSQLHLAWRATRKKLCHTPTFMFKYEILHTFYFY